MKYVPVVVTFNRCDLLKKSLDSLLNQTVKPQKIVIIDNASTDDTEKVVQNYLNNSDLFHYVKLSENVGGSGGFSRGVKEAMKFHPDWVALSDDDSEYEKNYFETINKERKNYPNVKVFTGTVVHKGTNSIETYQRGMLLRMSTLKGADSKLDQYKHNFYFNFFTFVGVVINADLIQKYGYPKDNYFIWSDDIEYSLRLGQHTKILNLVNTHIYHNDDYQFNDLSKVKPGLQWKEFYGVRNTADIMVNYNGKLLAWIVALYRLAHKSMRVFFKKELGGVPLKGYRWQSFKMITRATFDGLNGKLGKDKIYKP